MKNIIKDLKEIYEESFLLAPLTIFVGSCLFVGILCLLSTILS